jgi:hypothetical protein
MQTYVHGGWGCPGALLSEDEAQSLACTHGLPAPYEGIGLAFRPFTEDFEGAAWGTVVVRDFGRAGIEGKLITDQAIQGFLVAHGTISEAERVQIRAMLAKMGLERLAEAVTFVFFPSNY